MTHCQVCGQEFSKAAYGNRLWANTEYWEHLKNNHGDYQRWSRRWNLIFGSAVVLLIAMPLRLFIPGRGNSPPLLSDPNLAAYGYSVIAVSVVTALVMVPIRSRGLHRFREAWKEQSGQSSRSPAGIQASQLASGDSGILQSIRELSQEFNVKDVQPSRIEWIDDIATGRGVGTTVPADYPMFERDRIVLPKRLEYALKPEEWRPLIASSLQVRSLARARRRRNISTWVAIALVTYAMAGVFTIPGELAQGPANLIGQIPIAFFVCVATLFVTAALLSPELRQVILFADRRAANLVGKEFFLDTLVKLEGLGEDPSPVVRRLSRYRRPSIRERIDNLRTAPPVDRFAQSASN